MRSLVNIVSDCWFPGWFPIPALISQMHQRGKIMPAFLHECLYCSALRHWSLLVSYTAQFYSWITVRKRDWIHTKPHQTWFPLHILECEVKPQNSALKERFSRAHKPGHEPNCSAESHMLLLHFGFFHTRSECSALASVRSYLCCGTESWWRAGPKSRKACCVWSRCSLGLLSEKRAFSGTSPSILIPLKEAQICVCWESSLPVISRDTEEKWDPVVLGKIPQSLTVRSKGLFFSWLL